MGGGMKAAYAAGQVSALNELGITADKVDFVVGASAGAVVATAYVGGPQQTKQGTAMMRGPLSHRDFINTTSVGRFIGGNVINLPYIQSLMEEGPYALDQDAIKQSSAELHYIVTEPAVGKDPVVVRFLNAKTLPSMTDGITATMSIPYLTGPIPRIDGEKFLDGAFSPLPIKEIISQFPSVTDILILPQNPFMPSEQLDPHLFSKMFSELLDSTPLGKINQLHQMEKYLMASKTLRESLEEIQTMSGVNIGVMWPPDDALHTTNIDGDRATAAVIASHRDTVRVLGGVQPEVVSLDESSNRHSSHDDSKRAA
jgi:predicted patatin/cPLA2 family phospholipase